MAEVIYYGEWICSRCGLKLRGFFKAENVIGTHFTDRSVECPDCGTLEDLVAKPYRLDKEIAQSSWKTVWDSTQHFGEPSSQSGGST